MTGPVAASADLLATIVAATRKIVSVRESQESFDALARRADSRTVRLRFARVVTERSGQYRR
jgi:hypothetical protein